MSLGRGAIAAVSAQLVAVAAGALTAVLIARVLGPEGKGAFTLLTTLAVILQQLTNFGVGAAGVRFVASGRARPADAISQTMLVSLGVGSLAALLLFAWHSLRPVPMLHGIPVPSVALALASVPLIQAWLSLQQLALAVQRQAWYVVMVVAFVLLQLGALVTLWVAGGLTLPAAMVVYFAANLGTLLLATIPLHREWRAARPRISWSLLWDSVQYGIGRHVVDLAELGSRRAGLFVVGAISGPTAAGVYSVAVTLGDLGSLLPVTVAPLFFARAARDEPGPVADLAAQACRVLLVLTAAMLVVLFALGPFVVQLLFGSRFEPAARILTWLLPGVLCYVIPKILTTALTAQGELRAPAIVSGGALVVLVSVSIGLAPSHGAIGAAAGTSIGMAVYAVGMLVVAVRRTQHRVWDYLVPRRGDFLAARRLIAELRARLGPGHVSS